MAELRERKSIRKLPLKVEYSEYRERIADLEKELDRVEKVIDATKGIIQRFSAELESQAIGTSQDVELEQTIADYEATLIQHQEYRNRLIVKISLLKQTDDLTAEALTRFKPTGEAH